MAWDDLTEDEAVGRKRAYVVDYLEVIRAADVVLIANYDKHGVQGYVGPNALVEAAFGRALGEPVAFLFQPGEQACRLEALALMSVCLDGRAETLVARATSS